MSDVDALLKEKQELIKEMLEMQQRFVELEHREGIDPQDFYVPPAGSFLEDYKGRYNEMAKRVNKIAHELKGSGHIH